MTRTSLAIAAVAFILFGFGCGDDEEDIDSDDPRAVVTRFIEAVNHEDPVAACELVALESSGATSDRCETGFAKAFEREDVSAVSTDDIGEVSYPGDTTARVENVEDGSWELVRDGGEWRMQLSR